MQNRDLVRMKNNRLLDQLVGLAPQWADMIHLMVMIITNPHYPFVEPTEDNFLEMVSNLILSNQGLWQLVYEITSTMLATFCYPVSKATLDTFIQCPEGTLWDKYRRDLRDFWNIMIVFIPKYKWSHPDIQRFAQNHLVLEVLEEKFS
jgi:hypothetical protein